MEPLYLDHAATTALRPEVREAMEPYLGPPYGNPSSAHAWGRRASAALAEARERAAAALGAHPGEVLFVRGGTESDNLAVLGRAAAVRAQGGTPLIVHSALEHPAVRAAAAVVAEGGGRTLELPAAPDAPLDLGALAEALRERPALVSVIWVNNEVGTVLPVEAAARSARAAGVPLHSDGVQAVGKVPVRVGTEASPDLLSLAAHKIGGPRSTGLLYVRAGTELHPLLAGGGQERGLRPGTEDLAGAWGMTAALELAVAELASEAPRLAALRDTLEARLRARVPELHVRGVEGPRAPHLSNVGFPGVDQDVLLATLDLEGVLVSGGSACSSGARRRSPVLHALYGERADGWATVRFSLGRGTTPADVERAAAVTAATVQRLAPRPHAGGPA